MLSLRGCPDSAIAKLKEEQHSSNGNTTSRGYASGSNSTAAAADSNPFVAAREAQRIVGSYPEDDVARASLEQLNEISRRATAAGMVFSNVNGTNSNRPATPSVNGGTNGGGGSGGRAGLAGILQQNGQGGQPGQGSGQQQRPGGHSRSNSATTMPTMSREESLQRIEELARTRPASANRNRNGQTPLPPPASYANGSDPFIMPGGDNALEPYGNGGGLGGMPSSMLTAPSITHSGLQVFTLGHLMPKTAGDDDSAIWSFDPSRLMGVNALTQDMGVAEQGQQQQDSPTQRRASTSANGYSGSYGNEPGSSSAYISQPTPSDPSSSTSQSNSLSLAPPNLQRPSSAQKLRVRRSTFVPGWAVPPRVLLVDDDAVSRKLSSKFLQVFGCTIDVAVDGDIAVNKMLNFEKYDLVLMVGCPCLLALL